jgi:starch-binding outer membrane protein, SusD/RagB family
MFYKKISAAILAVALLAASGCKRELLSPDPLNRISEAAAFSTPDRFLSQLNGLYDFVKDGDFMGSRYIVQMEIRGEDYINETGNAVTGLQTWAHTLVETSNEVNFLWRDVYRAINACNIYIDGVQKNQAVLNNAALANQYIAEARTLRALCYWGLVTIYARPFADNNGARPGILLRLTPETKDGNNELRRSSVAEVYTQILADLNAAEPNLPLTQGSALNNTVRAHRNTAIALKTRVLLSMQRYADVITEANKIVSAAAPFTAATGVAHALQASVRNVFAAPYTTTESIFSMPYTTNDLPGTQNGLGHYYNPGPRGNGEYSLNPRGIVGDTVNWRNADIRRQMLFATGTGATTKQWLNKWSAGPEHLDYSPVIRYSEVLLNLAEAIARTQGVNDRALALLNAVRRRSDPGVTFTAAQFADGAALARQILLERRIELLGEGFRSNDCLRLLLPIPGKGNVQTINVDRSEYIWPIPQSERAVNPACEPNP